GLPAPGAGSPPPAAPGAAAPPPEPPPAPSPAPPAGPAGDGGVSGPMDADAFAAAAGLDPGQLADCVQYGLLVPDADGRHPAADLPVARAAAGLARHGIEARHLRFFRTAAEREADLVEQLLAPVLRSRAEDARDRAAAKLAELSALSVQLHRGLLEARLRGLLPS
ncbi:MerR family transcriptional regulator, partial [Geodermatophilus sp. SYSU D01106]